MEAVHLYLGGCTILEAQTAVFKMTIAGTTATVASVTTLLLPEAQNVKDKSPSGPERICLSCLWFQPETRQQSWGLTPHPCGGVRVGVVGRALQFQERSNSQLLCLPKQIKPKTMALCKLLLKIKSMVCSGESNMG